MTRKFSSGLADLARTLNQGAGSFLDGTVREAGITCDVCAAPVAGYSLCFRCQEHANFAVPIADRVASSVYAVEPDSQTYRIVRDYKGQRPVRSHQQAMSALLALGLRGHADCASKLAGERIDGWALVPSTQGRSTLRNLVVRLARFPAQEIPVRYSGPERHREFTPEFWPVELSSVSRHVLLIDDSWVTGGHAQSVAASLKAVGAQRVSIFTVARVLDPQWDPTREFIRGRLGGGTFDWIRCPWTSGACPEEG